MDDKGAPSAAGMSHVLVDACGQRVSLAAVGGHRQHLRRLVHHQQIAVFVDDGETRVRAKPGMGRVATVGLEANFDPIAGRQLPSGLVRRLAVQGHAAGVEQPRDVRARAAGQFLNHSVDPPAKMRRRGFDNGLADNHRHNDLNAFKL